MSGRLVMLPVGQDPDVQPGEKIASVTKLIIDELKNSPLSDREASLAVWLADELVSFKEAENVLEDFKRRNPDKMDAWSISEFMLKKRGKGWGKWKHDDNVDGLSLTTGDIIDQKTLLADYVDRLSVLQWYIAFRKRRLKLCIRYAEQTNYTIEEFQSMNEKIINETVASVPGPAALTAQAKVMHKEAESRPDQITELLNKTLAAKEALYAAMADLGETVSGFKKLTDEYSKDLHAFRSSVILDLGAAKKEMADVRKFFLEKEHVTEIDRLKEFIQLCERLKALKDAGVLDVITDAILKLEGA